MSFSFSSLSAMDLFISDRIIFRKEAYRYFGPASYFGVKAAMDYFLLRALPNFVFCCIVYWRAPRPSRRT